MHLKIYQSIFELKFLFMESNDRAIQQFDPDSGVAKVRERELECEIYRAQWTVVKVEVDSSRTSVGKSIVY